MHNITVIVAEDEKLLLDNLMDKIAACGLGFRVICGAQTGKAAWEQIEIHSPDLVVTDIKMPDMNGIELMEKVRLRYPFTKFIITSGFSDFEYAKSAIRLQASDYLLKPIDPEELYRALCNIRKELNIQQEKYAAIFHPDMASGSPKTIAETLKDYLIHNYTDDINLNLIAANMNYSSGYLTKIFQQYYDTSPLKFIIMLRITAAKQMLRGSALGIGRIGEAVGYHDQGYFSRIFKKQTGLSPYDYRDQYQQPGDGA